MKQDLKIKITNANQEALERNYSYFNPQVTNEVAQSIATALVDLTTNTYQGAERITTTDVQEAYPFGGLLTPNLRVENNAITWEGNGECTRRESDMTESVNKGDEAITNSIYTLTNSGNYAKDWITT